MEYGEALRYMQGRLRLGLKLGNDRLLALLDRVGNPQDVLRVVHIAGTKGKGLTTAMAASVLQAAGCRVGQYLSPYVYDVRERIQINGVPIPEDDFARWVTILRPHIEALERTEHGPTTEFELKTAVGLCYFTEQGVDCAVVEVGLGGRLDATNVVSRPLVTAITTIGYDHTELLGHTLGAIAREKAGIVKPGIPCVTAVPQGGEAFEVIAAICAERGAPLSRVTPEDVPWPGETTYGAAPDGTLALRTPRRRLSRLRLRLRGAFQHGNAAAAVAALDAIPADLLPPLSDDAVRRGLETAWLPGRLEKIADCPTVLADGAHNEMAAEALAEALRGEYGADRRRLILVVGLRRTHDPETFLGPLAALRPAVLIATQPSFQPRPWEDIAVAAKKYDIADVRVAADSVADAAGLALSLAGPDDIVCVTGSFYTIGDLPPHVWSQLLEQRKP